MFSPKFVLKGNLQACTHVPYPPPSHCRPGVHGARGDVCHTAPVHGLPEVHTRVPKDRTVACTCCGHTCFWPRV